MAMIQCPECGKEISSQAVCCPECGYPLKKARQLPPKPAIKAAAGVLGAVILVVLLMQTTIFWNKDEKALLKCAELIQADLLAPESLRIYDAMIWHDVPDSAAESASEGEEEAPTTWIWVHYGAGTKGGGTAEDTALFEKSETGWTKYKQADTERDDPKQAAIAALHNIWMEKKVFMVQSMGETYTKASVKQVVDRLT